MKRYFDDLSIGETFGTPGRTVPKAEIIEFANRYDPQPFHLDEISAEESMFGQIIASGLHTLCLSTRLTVDGFLRGTANFGGLGIDEVQWTNPVYPGDRLNTRIEVIEKKGWRDADDRGSVILERTTMNQDDEVVMNYRTTNIIGKRV